MNKTIKNIIPIVISILILILLSERFMGIDFTIGIVLIGISAVIFIFTAKKDIFNPIGIFSASWLGAIGLATFRLSNYQLKWSFYTWFVVILAYIMFGLGYIFYSTKLFKFSRCNDIKKINMEYFYNAIIIFFVVCFMAFLVEVAIEGYIPLFSKRMEAYMEFGISGIHYFTVSIAMLPSISLIYKKMGGTKRVSIINIISVLIPILIVSRQLILFQVIIFLITYNYFVKKIDLKVLFSVSILSIILFSIASNLRHQSLEYIYSVSNMKTRNLGILTQPYLYITINFENLRNIIENFNDYKFGLNMLFPIFAFTKTKNLIDYSYISKYFTNPLFNTSTYLSDIYFDFGIFGVIVINGLLGIIFGYIYLNKLMRKKEIIYIIVYSILCYSLIFVFFVNFFYNPTIWFYLIILFIFNYFIYKNH